jgi:hypothetical protein
MYRWLVFVHVAGAFGFALTHGASLAAALALRQERKLERVQALLLSSTSTFGWMYGSLLVLLLSGILAGFLGRFWGRGWLWAALVLLVLISVLMSVLGTRHFTTARRLAGLPHMEQGKIKPAGPAAGADELNAALNRASPALLAAIGYGGLLLILWLMMFKPF